MAVVAVLSTTVALGACSSEGPRLSRAGFVAKANKECTSLKEASDSFGKAQDPSFKGAKVQRFAHRVAERLRELVGNVDALVPPEELEENVDLLLAKLGDYADGLHELADTTKSRQTFQEVIDANPRIVKQLNGIAPDVTTLVGELGLVDCILPS
jgi:hypothetical protein